MNLHLSSLLLIRILVVALTFAIASCKEDQNPIIDGGNNNAVADQDNDGIPDAQDQCPGTPGNWQYNGCPPPAPDWWKVDICSGNSPYNTIGYKWSNLTPAFYYSTSLNNVPWRDYVDYAASVWNAVQSRLEIRKYTNAVSNGVGNDNKNVISYGPMESGILGRCYIWYNTSSGALVEADIKINSNAQLVIGESPNKYDAFSVLVHEFGHFTGLDHVNDRTHSMYSELHDDSIIYRTLCAGDKLGLLRLY
ncbi:MAG: matrixin family metalloprotease [Bacteroidota bacterium]